MIDQGTAPQQSPHALYLKVLLQIHARVERSDLVVTIEHQRRTPEKLAQAALFGLAPTWMIHVGVHVGVKSVFVRVGQIPSGVRLFFHQLDFHERLDAFESILPWQHHAYRSAILIGERFPITYRSKAAPAGAWLH